MSAEREFPWSWIIFGFGLLLAWLATVIYAYHCGYERGWMDMLALRVDALSVKFLN